jgi:hypothetical protein
VTASITDNDSPGISLVQSEGGTAIAERGAMDSYGLLLTTAPTANVTINFDTGSQINAIAPVTFTPNNWNVAQNFTVKVIDDSIAQGTHSGTIDHTSLSTDTNYNNLTISPVTATIADNDTTGVSISHQSTTATESRATGSFTHKLNSPPTAPVTISFEAGNQISAIATITFDATNWNVAKPVTVTATDDVAVEDIVNNHPPVLNYGSTTTLWHFKNLPLSFGRNFKYTFPTNTFTDYDPGDNLTYSATLKNGEALPNLLTFNQNTRTFQGTILGLRNWEIKLTATDTSGATASDVILMKLSKYGTVIDGYISGATLFLDANKNGVLDVGEQQLILTLTVNII